MEQKKNIPFVSRQKAAAKPNPKYLPADNQKRKFSPHLPIRKAVIHLFKRVRHHSRGKGICMSRLLNSASQFQA